MGISNPIAKITCDYEGCEAFIEFQPSWIDPDKYGYSWRLTAGPGRVIIEEDMLYETATTASMEGWLVEKRPGELGLRHICPKHKTEHLLEQERDKIAAARARIDQLLYDKSNEDGEWWDKLHGLWPKGML